MRWREQSACGMRLGSTLVWGSHAAAGDIVSHNSSLDQQAHWPVRSDFNRVLQRWFELGLVFLKGLDR